MTALSQAVFQSARSDAHGDFTIRHLTSGSYRLYFSGCKGDRYAAQARPGKVRVHAPHAVRGVNLEVVIAIGHTDSIGTDAYNQKLSVRRAEAVKKYLSSKGVEGNRIYTEGKGEKQPVASNKTKEGRAKNRRTEIEVIGTRRN